MRRNILTIPPGVPFLATFVEALLSGEIVTSLSRDSAPLDFAKTTIYVPTQRAGRALAAEFARAIDKPAALLPRILPLGGLDEQETAALFRLDLVDGDFDDALAPAIDDLERRLILARLVMQWASAIRHAIVSIDPTGRSVLDERETLLVAPSPVSAFALAGDLGALIDEFIIENVDLSAMDGLAEDTFDQYWAITTQFLRIALHEWPTILAERGLMDNAARQKALIESQIARLATEPCDAPIIALGSTGANPATARLLRAIASLDNGAVVLPGLDRDIDDAAWRRIGHAIDDHGEPAFTHPQSMLKRLLSILEIARENAREIGAPPKNLRERRALLANALLPADATQTWRDFRAAHGDAFAAALEGVTFVEAADERLEALALALFMRQALETPGRTAALITPDRDIARRVAAELARFDIDIDDSGGKPLSATSVGSLARLLATIAEDGLGAVELVALLAHPLTCLGISRERVVELAPLAEIAVLRTVERGASGWAKSIPAARELAAETHAYPAARALDDETWRAIEDVLTRVDLALAPFAALSSDAELTARVEAHHACLEAIVAGSSESMGEGAEELLALFERLQIAQAPSGFDASAYAALFDALALETILRGPRRAHPRLKILGPIEARLIDADLILLAGLDENIWPPQTDAGAFLNRSMRRQLGLSPPERRIGQSAHDFTMAFGAREVVVSRALKRNGSPTVASRLVTRLAALAGDAFDACRARGAHMLAIAALLDHPRETRSVERPEPKPDVALRPKRLSVTRIETLRRDPYAIYAEHILRLVPLAPLGAQKGAREMGTAIHEALAEFVRTHPCGDLPDDARERLLALARKKLGVFLTDPAFLAFDWPRVEAGLDHALAFERERRALGGDIFVEARGLWRFALDDGSEFTLSCYADRIEVGRDGVAQVFDYKTGAPPTNPQVRAWSPQLTLEAAMIEAGAFKAIGKRKVESAAYVRLGGAEGGKTQWIKCKDIGFAELVAEHRAQLFVLLNQFRDSARSYPSRPYVAFASRQGDYDHLARVKEWSRGGGDESE